ncbi:MAG: CHAP domain-containing protein [Alphaproteobacteria bacterium]|nr:CHAP domain-containing protein [Alphaproteobacteria bacterium]
MNEKIATLAENAVGKNREQVNCKGTYAWCAKFVSNILKDAGINIDTYSCSEMFKIMKSRPSEWSEPDDYPTRGDIIFFDWDRIEEEKPLDHVGIVTGFNYLTKHVEYVNGNGSNADYVTKQSMNIGSQYIAYWLHYIGDNADRYKEIEKQLADLKIKIEKIKSILDN